MQRIPFICLSLLTLFVVLVGCRNEKENADSGLGKENRTKKKQLPKDNDVEKDSNKDQTKQGTDQNGGRQEIGNAAEVLVGSWKATFVVDDEAFEGFVDANMLSEDLAKSEKERWNESTISIVFNSDGSCVFTEPDGNFYNAKWEVSKTDGSRVSVAIKASEQSRTLSVVVSEGGDEYTCEFVDDDQYDYLPIKKPLVFARE
jgi:hypothetical protein